MSECDAEADPPLQLVPRKVSISVLSDSETLFEESLSPKPRAKGQAEELYSHITVEKNEENGEKKKTREEFCSRPRLTGAQWSRGLQQQLDVNRKILEFKARGYSNEKIAEGIPEYYYMDGYHTDELPGKRRGKETS
jgi:hypothetical protein